MGIHIMTPLYEQVIKPGWGPLQETIYPALTYDGYLATWLGHPFNTYPLNWAAPEDGVDTASNALTLLNHDHLATASIYRGVLFFNTAALPGNAWIISAFVSLSTVEIENCRSASLCLTPASSVHTPLVATDYSALLDTPSIIGTYPIDDITELVRFNIVLTSGGLEAITKAGTTRFGARIDYEIAADPCSTCYEGIRIISQEHIWTYHRPQMTVAYRLPL